MLTVKLGGSLYDTLELKQWLNALANHSQNQAIIIVPGGGPFADQVRTAQSRYNFDDRHAHHMAILAMAQFAILIAAMEPQCQFFHYPNDANHQATGLSVWLPDNNLLSVKELPHSWEVTSDSLALWLSQQLDVDELIIVKRSKTLPLSVSESVNSKILDSEFELLYQTKPIKTRLLHYQDHTDFKHYTNKGVVLS